jgi:ribosomal protein L40E
MQCLRSQQGNPIHARFCLGCGARLALVYGACGADLPQEARFCLQCGHARARRLAAPARATAPESYTRCIATQRRLADE